jgi:hypothetical protein
MKNYRLKGSPPFAGTAEDFSYRIETSPDPCGFGYGLILVDRHVGVEFRDTIVIADTVALLDRKILGTGFAASDKAEIALDDLVRRDLAERA